MTYNTSGSVLLLTDKVSGTVWSECKNKESECPKNSKQTDRKSKQEVSVTRGTPTFKTEKKDPEFVSQVTNCVLFVNGILTTTFGPLSIVTIS